MASDTYACSWQKKGQNYRLFLIEEPGLYCESEDFEAASESLAEKIGDRFGDDEPVLTFNPTPPLGVDLKKWTVPQIFCLGYNERVECNVLEPSMHTEERCRKCGYFRGPRTSRPLVIHGSVRGNIAWAKGSRPKILLFSEEFLNLFNPSEFKTFRFVPVETSGRSRRRFFELSGKAILPFVGFDDAEYNPITNWKCSVCGRLSLYPYHGRFSGTGIQHFISKVDLPIPSPTIFAAGSMPDELHLCVISERWKRIAACDWTKGIVPNPLGIVPDGTVVRQPTIDNDYPN